MTQPAIIGDGRATFGVCYYPEHWPEERWADDAARMHALGIRVVRIGEFAWSRIEPARDLFRWEWLDRAIDTLDAAGLQVILGTPTACPPKWLVDELPEILPVGPDGRPRGFGSRRHYCFSSPAYRAECGRIVEAMARRYGEYPAVVGWQTDNEFGCHDTVLSYSAAALAAFREWLADRYGCIERLNEAWGTVFWSQEYAGFDAIGFPAGTVTEANPAHVLDFRRFSSAQVARFNREQVELLRRFSPGRLITHNFMGFFTGFDHYPLGRDLDAASWDSYPLGFLQEAPFDQGTKREYRRQGHPDFAAFHHDLYRGVGSGRFWVMEQQPGPVNWATSNAAPLPGMVRLWLWEAIAHGADLVSLFRWRRAPFGQEQMHAGLLQVDGSEDRAAAEVARASEELGKLDLPATTTAPVALVFDYESCWVTDIQPHAEGFSALWAAFDYYSGLRRLSIDVDIVPPGADLSPYRLLIVPCLPVITDAFVSRLETLDAPVLFGPRTGSKTAVFQVPGEGEPGPLQRLIPLRVSRVDALAPGVVLPLAAAESTVHGWLEEVATELEPLARTAEGGGVWYETARRHYLAAWPDQAFLQTVLQRLCDEAGLATQPLPDGLRVRRRGELRFAFNYARSTRSLPDAVGAFLIGGPDLGPGEIAVWH